MPTYDYKCSKCGHTFEGVAKVNDPNPPCPVHTMVPDPPPCQRGMYLEPCEGPTEKVISAVAIHFQGGGWAKDGYSK